MANPTSEIYHHKGKEFHLNTSDSNGRFEVIATLNGDQVSPTYSVDISTNYDFFAQHKKSLVEHLIRIAKSDISSEMYFRSEA